MKGLFENARRTFGSMPAGMLQVFESGANLAPGITAVNAHGHTPGMTMFDVRSDGRSFIFLADLTNIPALFARNPDLAVAFDMDAEAARKTRRMAFERIVASKALVGGFHFPFPAVGSMEAVGAGYEFKPVGLA